jgi:hypothetical protein
VKESHLQLNLSNLQPPPANAQGQQRKGRNVKIEQRIQMGVVITTHNQKN